MQDDIHRQNKRRIAALRGALYNSESMALRDQLRALFAPDCTIHLSFPFETVIGPDVLYERVYRPLLAALPDAERRDWIVIAGEANGDQWVGCAGHYMGLFQRPFLDIPPTGQIAAMRFHEFFRFSAGRIVEMQALWDLPELMHQAGAWPLAPSLGVEWLVPGPATQDGIVEMAYDSEKAQASVRLVLDMLRGLGRSQLGVQAMELERYWHPRMNWYGPAGIGTARRVSGFRSRHQIPFLKAMPDRKALLDRGVLFGDHNYVGFTAWPGMQMTLEGDGWLGIAPSGRSITMRSLDFWRCEQGLLRENWVLIDLLHVYDQLGVDVFARMRELTRGRGVAGASA